MFEDFDFSDEDCFGDDEDCNVSDGDITQMEGYDSKGLFKMLGSDMRVSLLDHSGDIVANFDLSGNEAVYDKRGSRFQSELGFGVTDDPTKWLAIGPRHKCEVWMCCEKDPYDHNRELAASVRVMHWIRRVADTRSLRRSPLFRYIDGDFYRTDPIMLMPGAETVEDYVTKSMKDQTDFVRECLTKNPFSICFFYEKMPDLLEDVRVKLHADIQECFLAVPYLAYRVHGFISQETVETVKKLGRSNALPPRIAWHSGADDEQSIYDSLVKAIPQMGIYYPISYVEELGLKLGLDLVTDFVSRVAEMAPLGVGRLPDRLQKGAAIDAFIAASKKGTYNVYPSCKLMTRDQFVRFYEKLGQIPNDSVCYGKIELPFGLDAEVVVAIASTIESFSGIPDEIITDAAVKRFLTNGSLRLVPERFLTPENKRISLYENNGSRSVIIENFLDSGLRDEADFLCLLKRSYGDISTDVVKVMSAQILLKDEILDRMMERSLDRVDVVAELYKKCARADPMTRARNTSAEAKISLNLATTGRLNLVPRNLVTDFLSRRSAISSYEYMTEQVKKERRGEYEQWSRDVCTYYRRDDLEFYNEKKDLKDARLECGKS